MAANSNKTAAPTTAKPAEAANQAEETKQAEAAKQAEETKQAEAAKQAEETKQAEAAKQAEEAKHAEAVKLAEEAKQAEQRPAWLMGSFLAKAKSPAGFWRCGVQFNREAQTRIFVVTDLAEVTGVPDSSLPYAYLTQEQAQRVFEEPQLIIEEE